MDEKDVRGNDMNVDVDTGIDASVGGSTTVELLEYVDGIEYPANKHKIIAYAEDQGADEEIIEMLERIPDMQFNTPTDLSREVSRVE